MPSRQTNQLTPRCSQNRSYLEIPVICDGGGKVLVLYLRREAREDIKIPSSAFTWSTVFIFHGSSCAAGASLISSRHFVHFLWFFSEVSCPFFLLFCPRHLESPFSEKILTKSSTRLPLFFVYDASGEQHTRKIMTNNNKGSEPKHQTSTNWSQCWQSMGFYTDRLRLLELLLYCHYNPNL